MNVKFPEFGSFGILGFFLVSFHSFADSDSGGREETFVCFKTQTSQRESSAGGGQAWVLGE